MVLKFYVFRILLRIILSKYDEIHGITFSFISATDTYFSATTTAISASLTPLHQLSSSE
jgi:hypothetical protein